MPQLLSLSRAARLAEVNRGELQRRIREGHLATFEGQVTLTDLVNLYPNIQLAGDAMFERVEHIKASARPRLYLGNKELPSAEILVSRLKHLGEVLVKTKTAMNIAEALLGELARRLRRLADEPSILPRQIQALCDWISEQEAQRQVQAAGLDHRRAQLFVKDSFLRVMAAHVRLTPSGHEFFVEGTDSILDAGVHAGITLRYGCSSGHCGSCKARVVSGEVWKIRDHDYLLSEGERQMGVILTCSNTAVTDVVLEATEALTPADIPVQEIRASVHHIDPMGSGRLMLHLQTPRTQTLRFMAGQWIQLTAENGASGSFPIASCPCDGRHIEFILRREASDTFSRLACAGLSRGYAVTLQGPEGTFVLPPDITSPVLFIAYRDGFAPIRSLMEHALSTDGVEQLTLVWVVPQAGGHYLDNLCRTWEDAFENVRYLPLVMAEEEVDGLIHALPTDSLLHPDGRIYLAGPPAWIQVVAERLRDPDHPGRSLVVESHPEF
ncbi:MAG: 2Fe-2S iron-sulfur cluster-binding protein [Pseudomonadota bacterium]